MNLALTYDDGPNPKATYALLVLFAKYGVKATFFMVGKWVETCPELANRVLKAGHQIGNHTQTHPKLTEVPIAAAIAEMVWCNETLERVCNVSPTLFRPPYILHNDEIDKAAEFRDMQVCLYQAAAGDGGDPKTADAIVDKIACELAGKSGIILMHDGFHEHLGASRDSTIEATERLIVRYQAEGAKFVFPQELHAT